MCRALLARLEPPYDVRPKPVWRIGIMFNFRPDNRVPGFRVGLTEDQPTPGFDENASSSGAPSGGAVRMPALLFGYGAARIPSTGGAGLSTLYRVDSRGNAYGLPYPAFTERADSPASSYARLGISPPNIDPAARNGGQRDPVWDESFPTGMARPRPEGVVPVAAGDLRCEGMRGGCEGGGDYGGTAAYRVEGRNLCYKCAVRRLGYQNEPSSALPELMARWSLPSR